MASDTSNGSESDLPAKRRNRGGKITAATRSALTQALNGKTTREIGDEKTSISLDWVYQWGWSTSSILAEMQETGKKKSPAPRLVKNKLLREIQVTKVSRFQRVPTKVVTLTPAGRQDVVYRNSGNPITPEPPDESGLNLNTVIHDLIVQRLTLMFMGCIPHEYVVDEKLKTLEVTSFVTAHQLGEDTSERKHPDAIWYTASGKRYAIELELNPKSGRRLDQFIRGHIKMQKKEKKESKEGIDVITQNEESKDRHEPVDGLFIFMTSEESMERYAKAMEKGKDVTLWVRDSKYANWRPHPYNKLKIPDYFKRGIFLIRNL